MKQCNAILKHAARVMEDQQNAFAGKQTV